jgi:ABC-type antimicrobial peptide transport system permease subunit
VAKNARTFRLREKDGDFLWFYEPLNAGIVNPRVMLLRTAPGAPNPGPVVRRLLLEMDPSLPFVDVEALGDALYPEMRPWRLGASVFTATGVAALLLAAIGLYSAVAFAVAQQRREIGVRMALGESSERAFLRVLGNGLRIVAAGAAAGSALALFGARWLEQVLYETSPREPLVYGVVVSAVLLASAVALAVPARRAARVAPAEALRTE